MGGKQKSPAFAVMQVKRKKHNTVISASAERRTDIMNQFLENQQKASQNPEPSEPLQEVMLNLKIMPLIRFRSWPPDVARVEDSFAVPA